MAFYRDSTVINNLMPLDNDSVLKPFNILNVSEEGSWIEGDGCYVLQFESITIAKFCFFAFAYFKSIDLECNFYESLNKLLIKGLDITDGYEFISVEENYVRIKPIICRPLRDLAKYIMLKGD